MRLTQHGPAVTIPEPPKSSESGQIAPTVGDAPAASRLDRMKHRPGLLNGNPEDLAEIDWSANWNPEANL